MKSKEQSRLTNARYRFFFFYRSTTEQKFFNVEKQKNVTHFFFLLFPSISRFVQPKKKKKKKKQDLDSWLIHLGVPFGFDVDVWFALLERVNGGHGLRFHHPQQLSGILHLFLALLPRRAGAQRRLQSPEQTRMLTH
jgi:hypothetical protein